MLFASGSSFRQEGNHKTALFYLDDSAVDYADYLVRKGMDVNARDARGCTPLMDQAGSGQIALVQLLLNHGAEIDAMDDHHNTPLIRALQDGHHRKVAALLIARGANVHHQNAVRESALWLASLCGFTEIVEPILRQGVNINVTESSGRSPLLMASWGHHAEIVRLLIAYGLTGMHEMRKAELHCMRH